MKASTLPGPIAACLFAATSLVGAASHAAAPPAPSTAALRSIAERTASMQNLPGLLPLHWDAAAGRMYLEIPRLNEDLLYVESLPYGLGSTDLGLDRGEISHGRIVHFERFGPRVLLIERNQNFRSSATDPAERRAVRESFPESVLASFKVEAEDRAGVTPGTGAAGAVLVDATSFFIRDAHEVAETLSRGHQDAYRLDPERSVIALDGTRAFPRNIEVEAILTFASDATARSELVREVTPDAHALSLREHQSFLALPGPGFEPRRLDPRAGYFGASYRDYSAPLGSPLDQQFILRHRLIPKDPGCTRACVAEHPIQYYVDRGAPEPIRSALLEGARWWDEAFQAAGWAPGTFRVDLLPQDADPMDVRLNIIQWVHRYTRGWSMGRVVADPRTGEIIKGNVTLGSLRGRQDYLIAEALLAPYGSRRVPAPDQDPMLAMVLARLRQLAAHETGHTLGLEHNFAASAVPHDPRQSVSVMDYPHPWITLDRAGVPDLSQAYATGIGEWDKVAIDYGYRPFAARADEPAALERILADAGRRGLFVITDADARSVGSAHPHASMWDNGTDPAQELERILRIRAVALERFGENAIRPGVPLSQLEDTLVPLYLLHRYQTEAALKEIGGLDYRYQLRGDTQAGPAIVGASDQKKALAAVLETIAPATLTLPERLLRSFPPRPPGYPGSRESLPGFTGATFDPIAAAECAADLTLAGLLDPQRVSRLVEYHARDARNPSLRSEVIDPLLARTAAARTVTGGRATGLEEAIREAIRGRVVESLLTLAANPRASAGARAIVRSELQAFRRHADPGSPRESYLADRIEQYFREPERFVPAAPIEAPPGMPIGDGED